VAIFSSKDIKTLNRKIYTVCRLLIKENSSLEIIVGDDKILEFSVLKLL